MMAVNKAIFLKSPRHSVSRRGKTNFKGKYISEAQKLEKAKMLQKEMRVKKVR